MRELQNSSFKYFYNFKPHKIFSPIFTQGDIQSLKSFASNKDIIITKPDKGRGVVIVNKNNYINSMQAIISDRSKCIPIDDSMVKFTLNIECKISRFLLKIKNLNIFTADVDSKLIATGSIPDILCGLPKTHILDFSTKFQFRPTFAAYKTQI